MAHIDEKSGSSEVQRVAGLLDDANSLPTRYRRFSRAQELLLGDRSLTEFDAIEDDLDLDDVDDLGRGPSTSNARLTPVESAAWAAMRFEPDIEVIDNRERVKMQPRFRTNDETDPASVDKTSPDKLDLWAQLATYATRPAVLARLHHLLFQAGGSERVEHAQSAVDAYIEVAASDTRASDAVHACRVAVRVARAIRDNHRVATATTALEQAVSQAISGKKVSVGAARQGLDTLVREQSSRVETLVDDACAKWNVVQVGGPFWSMKLHLAKTPADQEPVWRAMVEAHIQAAEASDSNIVRATRLRDALAVAEQSGLADLRDRAAALLQGVRHQDLEMMHVHASTHRFEEEWEGAVAAVLGDSTVFDADFLTDPGDVGHPAWLRRLLGFTNFEPPTGDPDANRAIVEQQQRAAPLQALLPFQLQTPEGLPLYAATTNADRFDLDMVTWEVQLLQQWAPIMGEALTRIARPDMPDITTLARVLSQGPASDENVGRQLAESFERYWAGDTLGSLYTSIPMIEALARNAVIEADQGIFRLQKNHSPGQYVGLNVLLGHLVDTHDMSKRDHRFLKALLTHPAGWNLRNNLAHGYLPGTQGFVAAVALYAAMRLLLIVEQGTSSTPGESSNGPVPNQANDTSTGED